MGWFKDLFKIDRDNYKTLHLSFKKISRCEWIHTISMLCLNTDHADISELQFAKSVMN